MAQCFVPIGVGDCPGIENEVSVGWHPSLKGEGLYHDREPISLFYDACCDRIAERARCEVSGVNQQVGLRRNAFEIFPFFRNSLG